MASDDNNSAYQKARRVKARKIYDENVQRTKSASTSSGGKSGGGTKQQKTKKLKIKAQSGLIDDSAWDRATRMVRDSERDARRSNATNIHHTIRASDYQTSMSKQPQDPEIDK